MRAFTEPGHLFRDESLLDFSRRRASTSAATRTASSCIGAAHTPISYTALSRSSRRLVLCSERVVFEPFALPVVAVAYNLANLTDCTCLAATHAALALHVAHITLCIVHTASIHPRHHRDSIHQPHTADPSHLAHVYGTTPVLAHTYDATAK